jgi:hypothetical protein
MAEVFTPGTPEIVTCTDQSGNTWSQTCHQGTCGCSYNDNTLTCMCTGPDGGAGCCPGVGSP